MNKERRQSLTTPIKLEATHSFIHAVARNFVLGNVQSLAIQALLPSATLPRYTDTIFNLIVTAQPAPKLLNNKWMLM